MDVEAGERGGWRARRQGGDGGGAGMVPRRGRGVEARVWSDCFCFLFFCFCFCFCFFCYQGDVWVEGGEASSAGRGQEAGKWVMYICHGRKAAVCNMKKQTN
jgi:hypothetical protein